MLKKIEELGNVEEHLTPDKILNISTQVDITVM